MTVAVALLAGCGGTRISEERILAAEGRTPTTAQQPGVVAAGPQGAISDPAAGLPAASATDPAALGSAAPATSARAAAPAGPAAGKGVTPSKNNTAQGALETAGTGTQPCTRQLAPIVLGQVGAFSGVVGGSVGNIRQGMAIWLQDVNARGGINCHPVVLHQRDDGSDPARSDAIFKDLVLGKKVAALVGVASVITAPVLARLAEQYKVPLIGGDASDLVWWGSEYLFPQGGISLASFAGAMKASAQETKAQKLGIMYCVEAGICSQIGKQAERLAKQAGLDLIANKAVSLTQTDFTAECQSMKSAGVQVAFIAVDSSAIQRAARSCKQVGFTVPLGMPSIALNSQSANDPNIQAVTGYLGSSVLPFTDTSTPGAKLFHKAFSTFAPGAPLDDSSLRGYLSGRMLEAALGKVAPQTSSGPVTSELILQGLWQIKNETFGGLTSPTTFTRGGPAKITDCYFVVKLTPEGFTAPLGSRYDCLPAASGA
jgi:branched-chain amino acid transport system substrate-binding protein